MNTLRISGIFQAFVGIGMIGIWMVSFAMGTITEVETEVIRISMHMMAELTTAILLLISGFSILLNKQFKSSLFHLSFGALIYTLIASPGYFAQLNQWGVVSLFLVLLVISLALLIIQSTQK